MAIDGTYKVILKTAQGDLESILTYKTEGNVLTGSVTALGNSAEVENGKVDGNSFEHSMKMQSPMGKLKTNVTGTVDGDSISGKMKMLIGNMTYAGTRIE